MPHRLSTADADFEARFQTLIDGVRATADAVAADIIADVRARGDLALVDYTSRFDRVDLRTAGFAIARTRSPRAPRRRRRCWRL